MALSSFLSVQDPKTAKPVGKKVKVTLENLGDALQQAIEIEIATIPVYLYTYYSINRSVNSASIITSLTNALVAKGMSKDEATKKATAFSDKFAASISGLANKSGAIIMSVVIEEMLHMALSSNIKQALRGMPELMDKVPDTWPAQLPGHEPPFNINRAALSLEQLKTFLLIELPAKPKDDPKLLKSKKVIIDYTTIGEFYDMIAKVIEENSKNGKLKYNIKSPQLIPGEGYYAPNNSDTSYTNSKGKLEFGNADIQKKTKPRQPSGDLVHVTDCDSAIKAINTIVDQGEGYHPNDYDLLEPDGTPKKCEEPSDGDDAYRPGEEASHFSKFLEIYCRFQKLDKEITKYNKKENLGLSLGDYFVYNFPVNPSTAGYPADIQKISNLLNAVNSYIFLMTEECYRKTGNTQYEIFMFGIHKSMIFILNSLCGVINTMQYEVNGTIYNAAPTFENYSFKPKEGNIFSAGLSPKTQIIDLYNTMMEAYPTNSSLEGLKIRIHDLPDVAL
jgi:hypothetical protein